MSDGESRSPIVDRASYGTAGAFGDAIAWARKIEVTARGLTPRLQLAVAEGNATAALATALSSVRRIVDESGNGTLARTLRRPWRQLTTDSNAVRTLSSASERAFASAAAALSLHDDVIALNDTIAQVRSRYAAELPALVAEHLTRARLSDADIARMRTKEALALARERLARVDEILSRYLAGDAGGNAEEAVVLDRAARGGSLTLRELRAALRNATRERAALFDRGRVDETMRRISADLVRAQDDALREPPPLSTDGAIVERLAGLALDNEVRAYRGGSDLPLWTGIIALGHNANFPRAGRTGWRPSASTLSAANMEPQVSIESDGNEAELFAIPVVGDYVCLSRNTPSLVRVWSRSVKVGRIAECVLATNEPTIDKPLLAAHDLPSVFDGLDAVQSAWYKTKHRAKLTVLFVDGDQWFARVTERGTIERLDHPASNDRPRRDGDLRILFDAHPVADPTVEATEASTVVQPIDEVTSFLGIESLWVRTPFVEHKKAIVRKPSDRSVREIACVRREREFFRDAVNHEAAKPERSKVVGLRLIADARLPRGKELWPVYASPFGVAYSSSELIGAWCRRSDANLVATMKAAARVLMFAHSRDYSLGLCHPECFSYSAWWNRLDSPAVPSLGLLRAPAATRLGEKYPGLPAPTPRDCFEMLGIDPVPPSVRSRKVAEPRVDGAAFVAFVLELLAKEHVSATSWTSLPNQILDDGDRLFNHPALARAIALRLRQDDSAVWEVLNRIWSEPRVDLDALGAAL